MYTYKNNGIFRYLGTDVLYLECPVGTEEEEEEEDERRKKKEESRKKGRKKKEEI